jgi:hypothetical protein
MLPSDIIQQTPMGARSLLIGCYETQALQAPEESWPRSGGRWTVISWAEGEKYGIGSVVIAQSAGWRTRIIGRGFSLKA